jgi:hypothetical protein
VSNLDEGRGAATTGRGEGVYVPLWTRHSVTNTVLPRDFDYRAVTKPSQSVTSRHKKGVPPGHSHEQGTRGQGCPRSVGGGIGRGVHLCRQPVSDRKKWAFFCENAVRLSSGKRQRAVRNDKTTDIGQPASRCFLSPLTPGFKVCQV